MLVDALKRMQRLSVDAEKKLNVSLSHSAGV